MLALFKSHYSIGKSILKVSEQKGSKVASVFGIASKNKLKQVIMVEDSLIGFLESQKCAKDLGIQLIFGLRISASHTDLNSSSKCTHKVIIFAKNDKGCSLLNSIYSHSFCENDGLLDFSHLKSLWDEDSLNMSIPFYDSFLFMNTMHFCSCIPDLSFLSPHFLIENNGLPFDRRMQSIVKSYCTSNGHDYSTAKSIYYENKEDFHAYQTYKCICSRQFKQRTLDVPNFDHLASDSFSFESYLEDNK